MKKFDYIVYGANLNGIITAVYLKQKGSSVLLLNSYGFPGGSITESLNCVQRIPKVSESISYNIFNRISEVKDGIAGREEQSVFLNPETIKYVCQNILLETEVDLLFHIIPVGFGNAESEEKELVVLGREGYVSYTAENFIDCSENYALYSLLPEVRKEISGIFLNLIAAGLKPENKVTLSEICNRKFILEENRIWYNFQLQNTEIDEIEHMAQIRINSISEELMKYSGRIQLVPPQTHIRFKLLIAASSPNVFHSDLIINYEFFLDDEFLKAEQLQNCLTDKEF